MLESLSQIPQQEWLPLLLVFTAIALTVFCDGSSGNSIQQDESSHV